MRQTVLEPLCESEQVDDQQPARIDQEIACRPIEVHRVQYRTTCRTVIEIDLHHPEMPGRGGLSPLQGILGHDLESRPLGGQSEHGLGRKNHRRIMLDRHHPSPSQVAQVPACQRPSSKSQHCNLGRRMKEKQPTRHLANIFQFERMRRIESDSALHPGAIVQMQITHAIQFRKTDGLSGAGARRHHRRPPTPIALTTRSRPPAARPSRAAFTGVRAKARDR